MIDRLPGLVRKFGLPPNESTSVGAIQLQSPQEIIIDLLDAHSGVTWQSHIIAEIDWSKGTVSRVLSTMEANGAIRRYRVKRQKVVCLPGVEPTYLAAPNEVNDHGREQLHAR